MTTHHSALPPLRTDGDVLDRVSSLVGPASTDRQLWIMFVGGDDRQAPAVMPVSDMPPEPTPDMATVLAEVVGALREDLVTGRGSGPSVILTWERLGPDRPLPADLAWAATLHEACRAGGIRSRGVFLSSPGGVQRLGSDPGPGRQDVPVPATG